METIRSEWIGLGTRNSSSNLYPAADWRDTVSCAVFVMPKWTISSGMFSADSDEINSTRPRPFSSIDGIQPRASRMPDITLV